MATSKVDLGSIKGPKGDSAYWSFEIDDNGDLIANYEEGTEPPDFSVDEEGNLIQNVNGTKVNLGHVVGPQGPVGETSNEDVTWDNVVDKPFSAVGTGLKEVDGKICIDEDWLNNFVVYPKLDITDDTLNVTYKANSSVVS